MLAAVVAAAITVLLITSAPMDFGDWPRPPSSSELDFDRGDRNGQPPERRAELPTPPPLRPLARLAEGPSAAPGEGDVLGRREEGAPRRPIARVRTPQRTPAGPRRPQPPPRPQPRPSPPPAPPPEPEPPPSTPPTPPPPVGMPAGHHEEPPDDDDGDDDDRDGDDDHPDRAAHHAPGGDRPGDHHGRL